MITFWADFGLHFGSLFRPFVIHVHVVFGSIFVTLFLKALGLQNGVLGLSWASSWASQGPKSGLPPRRDALVCFRCCFSCRCVLAALGLPLGLLLVRCWSPKFPDRTRSRPGSVPKKGPKNNTKKKQNWGPKMDLANYNFLAKTGHGRRGHFGPPVLWRCLACLLGYLRPQDAPRARFGPQLASNLRPKLPQELHFDPNLRQICA